MLTSVARCDRYMLRRLVSHPYLYKGSTCPPSHSRAPPRPTTLTRARILLPRVNVLNKNTRDSWTNGAKPGAALFVRGRTNTDVTDVFFGITKPGRKSRGKTETDGGIPVTCSRSERKLDLWVRNWVGLSLKSRTVRKEEPSTKKKSFMFSKIDFHCGETSHLLWD